MKLAFSNIVEAAYRLPIRGKLGLKKLLEYNIIEERRNEIAKDFKQSKEDLRNGNLKFSDHIKALAYNVSC